MFRKLSDLKPEKVKSVICPRCGAQPGEECLYVYMGISRDGVHMARKTAARNKFAGRATGKTRSSKSS